MHKAHNLLHTSQPPNDSMLAIHAVTTDPWMTEAMSLLIGSETTYLRLEGSWSTT